MFREGTCPKCHQVIQVPDDREKVICMYCGEEIRVDEALGAKEEVKEIDREAYQEYFDIARNELEQVILTCYNPMENFKKNLYEGEFEAYYAGRRALFEALLHDHPAVREIRRSGLLLAVELGSSERLFRAMALLKEAGYLSDWFLFCDTAFRISPPLTITEEQIRECCAHIRTQVLDQL